MSREADLKREAQKALEKLGVKFFRMNSGKLRVRGGFMQLCPEGTADLLVCIPQAFPIWLELKGEGQKTAKERQAKQEAFAEEMREMGHSYFRCTSVDDVVRAVTRL